MNKIKIQLATLFSFCLIVSVSFWSCNDTDYLYLPDAIKPLTVTSVSVTEAEIGDQITITGTNFSLLPSNNKVLFNTVEAEVVSATETELVVIVPNAVASGEVISTVPLTVSHGSYSANVGNFKVSKPIKTLVITLTDENDDVEEVAVLDDDPDAGVEIGTMDLASSDLEIGEVSSGQGLMNIGLRFNGVSIPEGSIISEAYIQFKTDATGSGEVEMTIYGENTANAEAYTDVVGNLSSRALTQANAVWNIAPWENVGDRGDAQKTVNISSIVQEIINQDDWASGNSINIILKNTGVSATATATSGGREAENYSAWTADDGAEITIVYR
ncbi:MAG: IPT/TIG domain-containing protein [Flavobacteriaceae bacterium]